MDRLYPSIKETEINDFLRDFEDNSETMLLTEASKQNEIITIAKNKGILLKDSFDLAGFKCVYAFVDKKNDNGDLLPKEELLRILPTLIGKPINLEHIRRNIVGMYIDYRYIEKESKIIAYGIFFKNVFSGEWEQFKKLLKQKKLKTSYEVWNDEEKEEKLSNGTRVLHDLQIAGGAILFRGKPAFEGCSVLAIAKKNLENTESRKLTYACLNKDGLCSLENKKGLSLITASEDKLATPIVPTTPVTQPVSNDLKIICSNCATNFEYNFVAGATSQIKCPNCFAILDKIGKMIYPPQVRDFELSCSKCQVRNNWLILTKNDTEAKVKCLSCASEYKVEFKKSDFSIKHIKVLRMLREVKVRCLQCGTMNEQTIPSTQKKIDIKCKKCGLNFSFDTAFKRKREIERIDSINKEVKKEDNKVEEELYSIETAKLELSKEEVDTIESLQEIVEGQKLELKERKTIPDNMFAVVLTKKGKSGKLLKIRKYPIDTKDRVRSALRYLGMPRNQATLRKLGVSVKAVLRKILRRAKELGMTELLKRRAKAMDRKILRKAVSKIRESRKEATLAKAKLEKFTGGIKKFAGKIKDLRNKNKDYELKVASLNEDLVEVKKNTIATATKVLKRREELGDFAKDLTDKDLVDETKYKLAKAKKIIAEKEVEEKKNKKPDLKTASLIVGDKEQEEEWAEGRKKVNKVAFGGK